MSNMLRSLNMACCLRLKRFVPEDLEDGTSRRPVGCAKNLRFVILVNMVLDLSPARVFLIRVHIGKALPIRTGPEVWKACRRLAV